jgi:hypothetical protein
MYTNVRLKNIKNYESYNKKTNIRQLGQKLTQFWQVHSFDGSF